jgi:phosphotransferase system enzyme I (PtsI)
VVQSARHAGIPIAICGEMAAEPAYMLILMGLGLEEFSMNPIAIPKVKKILRMVSVEETKFLAEILFKFSTAKEIKRYVRNWMAERFPEDYLKYFAEELKA